MTDKHTNSPSIKRSEGTEMPSDVEAQARALGEKAARAARELGCAPTEVKNRALEAIARKIEALSEEILAANHRDMTAAMAAGMSEAMQDRLKLTPSRLEKIASAIREVKNLSDPVGEVTETKTRPNGLVVSRVRIPLGAILMIYESRPNVTPDAAALCLKSGNVAILRGGKEALHSNLALGDAIREGLSEVGLPTDAVQVVHTPDRALMLALLHQDDLIDLCIPRGGESLIRFVAQNARIPVLKHFKGVCHVYLHASATPEKAVQICLNAKVQRPGVCNAAECLLFDKDATQAFLAAAKALVNAGVELRAESNALGLLREANVTATPASDDDFGREFLSMTMAVKMVANLDGALEHIARFGSMHTEAIVAEDPQASEAFARKVVASAVVLNASTRFNDGGELGLGAEIGISTTKLHAFGPMGLEELTTRKFIVRGDGQIRS